ncbi:hypothetical protein [Tautonia rosea]|uniref:hypothetical protein n=1 Tax=Tautonia rosea TaxID=2728037 RepID=UPI0014746841|nr:hypothetical protein [Tautonia rosea]
MENEHSIGAASAVLAVVVIGIAFVLTWRQRLESRRPRNLADEADARYFARQDRRRYRGAVLLAMLGLGIGVGGNIDIRAGQSERIAFVVIWILVLLLVLQTLLLAFLDLWSTRRYADRQRRKLAEERRQTLEREIEAVQETFRRSRTHNNGKHERT